MATEVSRCLQKAASAFAIRKSTALRRCPISLYFREFEVARQLQLTTAMHAPVAFPVGPRRPTHEQIARLAYQLYLAGGRKAGLSVEDWLCAEYLLRRNPPTASEPPEPQPNRALMPGAIRLVSARKVPSVAASPAPVSVPLAPRRLGPMTAPALRAPTSMRGCSGS